MAKHYQSIAITSSLWIMGRVGLCTEIGKKEGMAVCYAKARQSQKKNERNLGSTF